MGIKQEVEVVKRNDDKKDVCVDDLVNGVQQCTIDNNNSKGKDLDRMFMKLNLEDSRVKKNVRSSQPTEDDERDARSPQQTVSDKYIELEAPTDDDKEGNEDSINLNHGDKETKLEERGPMLGVPSNFTVELGHNSQYQFQTNYTLDDSHHHTALPENFPNYSLQACRSAQEKGSKRGMDDREVYHEPPKYVRPQNNLNAPWNGPNSGMTNANGRTVSQVYHKQMSGGTVYAPEDIPDDQLFNDRFSSPDQLEFQDLFDNKLEESLNHFDFLSGPELTPPQVMNQQVLGQCNQMPCKMSVGHQQQQQQQWRNVQSPLAHASQLPTSFANSFQQQQQQFENYSQQTMRQYQESGPGKRGSFGNDDYSDGYGSDLSPSNDVQSPPAASPCSVMEASPATLGGSPPRTNWSPPPSNMSHSSVDSGVCSPMADEQNGYTSVISPKQGHSMSPQSTSCLAPTPQTRVTSSSPPHQYMSPGLSTYQTVAQDKQVIPREDEVYVHPYIDAHLPALDCALEVASQDLMAEKLRKGFPAHSTNGNTSVHISNGTHVNNMINNINMDIYTGRVTMPPHSSPPFCGNNRQNNNTCSVQARKTPQISQKQNNISNLPTTVPATISFGDKKNIYQPSAFGVGQTNVKVSTGNSISNMQARPPQSIQGKIAIPPMNPKPRLQPIPGQMLPVFVATSGVMTHNGLVTPVFIMPQNVPQQSTAQRKLPTLIPKEPVKQKEQTVELIIKPANAGNAATSSESQGKKSSTSTPNAKKAAAPSDEKLLNLARRLVAEMSADDLKYKDEDGDMYLHVAVCKADRFMVQALLERLARENLIKIIDMQNSAGQTPLYLAVSTNHTEMVQLLVEQGADVSPFAELPSQTGYVEKTAAIHCASTKGEEYLDTLKALLKALKINLNQVNSDGHTALICAILAHGKMTTKETRINSVPIIRALIQAGADPNLQVQQSGKTALMYTLESRDLDLIESTFQLVDPQKLPIFLNTMAFDSSSCIRIADSIKPTLDQSAQQRLVNCLRHGSSRGFLGSLS